MNTFRLAIRLGIREWHAGKWTILLCALLLAVTAFTAQYFFSLSLQHALNKQAAVSLGGDMVISSPTRFPDKWLEKAEIFRLRHAQVWLFPTVIVSGQQMQLANIQAVTENFPLSGDKKRTQAAPVPPRGFILLDKRLIQRLSLTPQSLVHIGSASFKVMPLIHDSPDILAGLSFAPPGIMNVADVEKTRILLPGSRIEYRLLLAGETSSLKKYRAWLLPNLHQNQQLRNIYQNQTLSSNILTQANRTLTLAIIMCIIMASAALLISAQYYMEQQQNTGALLRCLGLTPVQLLKVFIWQLFILALIGSIGGIIIAYSLYAVFSKWLSSWLLWNNIASVSFLPILGGAIVSMLLLAILVLPAFIKLSKSPPVLLWRTEKKLTLHFSAVNIIILSIIACGIFYILTADILFVLYLLNILVVIIASLYGLLYVFFRLFKVLFYYTPGIWRQGGLNILRYESQSSVNMIGFSITIAVILLLYAVRVNFLAQWQSELPAQTPNYFVINIAPEQLIAVQQALHKLDAISSSNIYPIVKGRMIALNHRPIMEAVLPSGRNQNALHRELNLSWMRVFPKDNKIVEGLPWATTVQGQPWISIEKNLAETLGIHLGDSLTFQVGDQQITGKVQNLRTLNWRSFHPNFYIIFPPGILNSFPRTYIASFYLPPDRSEALSYFTRQFPNVTLIDVTRLLSQAKIVLDQAIKAIQYVFLLTLIAGVLLLWATIYTSLSTREQVCRWLRIVGAGRYYVYGSVLVEFCLVGVLAGLLGAVYAALLSFGLAHYWLQMTYILSPALWLKGIFLGLLCFTLPALLCVRRILKTPPLLRE